MKVFLLLQKFLEFFQKSFTYLILPIFIKVKSDHSAHFPADDIPKDFVPLPVDGLYGTVATDYGQGFRVFSEASSYDNVYAIGSLFKEEIRVVVNVVCWNKDSGNFSISGSFRRLGTDRLVNQSVYSFWVHLGKNTY